MPQSLAQLWVHIIFSTKNREPFLQNMEIRKKVHGYLAGICKRMKSPSLVVGGVADHVHILSHLSKNLALKDLIQYLKQDSSKWVKLEWSNMSYFYWQKGYGAFSVCPPHVDAVRKYISNQEIHHRNLGFKDEFLWFLNRYGIAYNERYLWD